MLAGVAECWLVMPWVVSAVLWTFGLVCDDAGLKVPVQYKGASLTLSTGQEDATQVS